MHKLINKMNMYYKKNGFDFCFQCHRHSSPVKPTIFQTTQTKRYVCIFCFVLEKNMLVKLCVNNYIKFDSLVNEADDIFKTSTTYGKDPLY